MKGYGFFDSNASLFGVGFYCIIPFLVVSDLLLRLPDEDFSIFFVPYFGIAHEWASAKHIVGFLVDGLLQGDVLSHHEAGDTGQPIRVALDLAAYFALLPINIVQQFGITCRGGALASNFWEISLGIFP